MTLSRLFPRALVATIVVGLCCVAAPGAAGAVTPAAGVSDPFPVQQGGQFYGPHVSVAPDGTVTAAWAQNDGASTRVRVATRSAVTGHWSDPQYLSPEGEDVNIFAIFIASDSNGGCTVVWLNDGGTTFVKSKTRVGSNTAWPENAVQLNVPGDALYGGALTTRPDGAVVAAISGTHSGTNFVRTLIRPAGSADFGDPTDVYRGTDGASDLALRYRDADHGVMAWKSTIGGHENVSIARYTSGDWTSVGPVTSEDDSPGYVGAILADNGDITLSWTSWSDGAHHLKAATVAAGQSTAGPVTEFFADDPIGGFLSQLAEDEEGNIVAVWQRWYQQDNLMYTATRDADTGVWSAPSELPDSNPGGGAVLLADAQGNLTVTYFGISGGTATVLVSRQRVGTAAWSAAESIGTADYTLGTAFSTLDADNNLLAVWGRTVDSGPQVVFALQDLSGPSLGDVAIPSAGTAGTELRFSVSPLDALSALGATSWDFGDGEAATGNGVGHTYATAGSYTVTVTSTDAFGNATSHTGSVTVTDPPPPPAPEPPVVQPPVKLPPVIPARLAGKKITITTTVPNCSSKFVATTTFGTTKYQTKLKLTKNGKLCTGTGVIVLKKAPSTRTKLRIAIGRVTKTGTNTIATLTTKRG